MGKYRFSVVIPLYNKRDEVGRAVRSALGQSYAPFEVIVVDDGSKDGGAEVVRAIDSPVVRLEVQPNGGVCVARNRAIELAQGDFIAFLDADDWWHADFLSEIASMIDEFPDCGIYSTAYRVVQGDTEYDVNTYDKRGIVEYFFRESMRYTICLTSMCVVPKRVFDHLGGFPVGMKLGEDQYTWTKIALQYNVCYSPKKMVYYLASAANRSSSIFVEEQCLQSLDEFYSADGNEDLNEYLARCSIGKAITVAAKGASEYPRHVERFYAYTKRYKFGLWKLRVINRLPRSIRWWVLSTYVRLTWKMAKKNPL